MRSLLPLLLLATAPAPSAPCPPPAGLEAWTAAAAPAGDSIALGTPAMLALSARPTADQPGAHAGAATLTIPVAGTYRIAIDQRAWIDMLGDGGPLASVAHEHGPDCGTIVKMVDFRLAAGRYRLAITRAPATAVRVLVVRRGDG